MAPRLAPCALFLLLPLFAPVASILEEWVKDTLIAPLPGNASVQQGCDYLQQAWALDVVRFKKNATQFMNLADLEPCTQTKEYVEWADYYGSSEQNGSVGLTFRYSTQQEGFLVCTVRAGTFIRDASSLYVVEKSEISPGYQISKVLKSADWSSTRISLNASYSGETLSLFMKTMSKRLVPGYNLAVDEANEPVSVHQDRVKELSPSNVAILLLPMLLSFVPASAISDDFTAYGTLLYALATDFFTNIPVLIKGGELLYINSLQSYGNTAHALLVGNAQVQFVEVFQTECEITLESFILGFTFVFLAIWTMAVGFTTEFLLWKFEAEKREVDKMHRDIIFPEEPQPQSAVSENEDIEPVRKRYKHARDTSFQNMAARNASTPLTSEHISRKRKHSDMVSEATNETASEPGDILISSVSRKGSLNEFVFFFVGVGLSVLVVIPFMAHLFLRFQYFRKTEQQEWFFKVGVMVGSLNIVYAIVRQFMARYYFYVFVFLFNLLLLFLLRKRKFQLCPCFRRSAPAQDGTGTNDAQESSEMRFYIAGLLLGLLLSVLSILYVRCFPWIRGDKRRRRMLKTGCMIGAFINIFVLEAVLFAALFISLGDYILLYNLVFLVALVLFDTDVFNCTAQA